MKTCLVVDDSRVVRKVARKILEDLGYTCTEAEHGEDALTQSKAKLTDLVLLDWNMPVMNGLDYLKQLRSLPNGNKPVVVFCTTENDMNHIQQAMAAGANEYIMKPFDSDIISGKLAQLGLIDG